MHLLQQPGTECTGWFLLHSLVHLLQQAEFNTQDSCKIDLATVFITGYKWLQSVPAGTGYTALYTCLNKWLQNVLAGTGYTALYTCFNNWLQCIPAGTGYKA